MASDAANASPYVQQELGAAVSAGKDVIPIIWKTQPESLPGFLRNIQALDLRHHSPEEYAAKLSEIAARIRTREVNQSIAMLIGAVLLVAFIATASKT